MRPTEADVVLTGVSEGVSSLASSSCGVLECAECGRPLLDWFEVLSDDKLALLSDEAVMGWVKSGARSS
jgi:hypothetical protein